MSVRDCVDCSALGDPIPEPRYGRSLYCDQHRQDRITFASRQRKRKQRGEAPDTVYSPDPLPHRLGERRISAAQARSLDDHLVEILLRRRAWAQTGTRPGPLNAEKVTAYARAVDDLLGEIHEILWPEGTNRPRLWRPRSQRPRDR